MLMVSCKISLRQIGQDDKKNVQYDLKVRNILISTLVVNEYHLVSYCKTAKAIGDASKPSMRVLKTLSNQTSLPSFNNLSYFT